jgi:hypothetical protein
MSRTSNRIKQRPKSIKAPRSRIPNPPEPSIFFTKAQTPAVFPPEITLSPPRSNRATTIHITAVRDPKSERLLVRKSENSAQPRRRKSQTTPVDDVLPKAKPTLPTRKGRTAAVGGKRSATKAQRPDPIQHLTPPPDAERSLPPVAATPITAAALAPPPVSVAVVPKHDIPTTPLPRSAAVVAYNKNGPFEILAFWLRSSGRKISALFKLTPKQKHKRTFGELERLRIENLALRRRIDRLMTERQQA